MSLLCLYKILTFKIILCVQILKEIKYTKKKSISKLKFYSNVYYLKIQMNTLTTPLMSEYFQISLYCLIMFEYIRFFKDGEKE